MLYATLCTIYSIPYISSQASGSSGGPRRDFKQAQNYFFRIRESRICCSIV